MKKIIVLTITLLFVSVQVHADNIKFNTEQDCHQYTFQQETGNYKCAYCPIMNNGTFECKGRTKIR